MLTIQQNSGYFSNMSLEDEFSTRGLTITTVASSIGVCHENVRLWVRGKRPVPAERAAELDRLFEIPRHLIRPDVFDPPKDADEAA